MLKAMHKAGANLLFIGYETLDEATAKNWHKGYGGRQSLEERMVQDTRILHDAGIWVHGMFVFGPDTRLPPPSTLLILPSGCRWNRFRFPS